MLECKNNRLEFSFPEVHPDAKCSITFERTLRLPDDDKTYPLPPSLGQFPLKHVDDYKTKLGVDAVKRGGVMLPMYQAEALWIRFHGHHCHDRGQQYPMAIKIAAGKRSAITANAWVAALKEGDYVVIPVQPWLDGFMISEGVIRQFVAAPLGQGFTVEEQLTKKAEFGGIQLEVLPMKAAEFEKRFPKRPPPTRGMPRRRMMMGVSTKSLSFNASEPLFEAHLSEVGESDCRGIAMAAPAAMGMAAGGQMKQEIHPDPYGLEVWDRDHKTRTFVHLFNSMAWRQITDENPPHVPPTAAEYKRFRLPWFEWYSDAGALKPTDDTAKIKSVQQMAVEKGYSILPENQTVSVEKTTPIHAPPTPHSVKDGEW